VPDYDFVLQFCAFSNSTIIRYQW